MNRNRYDLTCRFRPKFFIIGVINNGLNMVGLSSYYQQIAMGVLIILAVTLDRFFGVSKNR